MQPELTLTLDSGKCLSWEGRPRSLFPTFFFPYFTDGKRKAPTGQNSGWPGEVFMPASFGTHSDDHRTLHPDAPMLSSKGTVGLPVYTGVAEEETPVRSAGWPLLGACWLRNDPSKLWGAAGQQTDRPSPSSSFVHLRRAPVEGKEHSPANGLRPGIWRALEAARWSWGEGDKVQPYSLLKQGAI